MHKKIVQGALGILAFSAVIFVAVAHVSVEAATCALESGKAYKRAGNSAVYYISSDCKKRPIRSPEVYFSHFTSWRDVTTVARDVLLGVPDHELSFLPWGPKRTYQSGTIMKTVDDPRIYAVLGGRRYPIGSEDVFLGIGLKWEWVEDVTAEVVTSFGLEPVVTTTVKLPELLVFKYSDSPKVYAVDAGASGTLAKRHIESFDTLTETYRLDRVVTLPRTIILEDGARFVSPVDITSNNPASGTTVPDSGSSSSAATSTTPTADTTTSTPPTNTTPTSTTATSTPAADTQSCGDGSGATGSGSTTTSGAPTVSFTSPASGSSIYHGSSIAIAATASDSNGTVSQVRFYRDSTLLATDTSTPYSYTWYGAGPGTYSLTAVATDNSSLSTTSTAVSVTVSALSAVTGMVPLTDISASQGYKPDASSSTLLYQGGLYPNGSNSAPSAHHTAGLAAVANVQPRNTSGAIDSGSGKIVMLSIGLSNTTQEFCQPQYQGFVAAPSAGTNPTTQCNSWTFMGQAAGDSRVRGYPTLTMINGARGGQSVEHWNAEGTGTDGTDADSNLNNILTSLTNQGLTEAQVQVIWLKLASNLVSYSAPSLTAASSGGTADAHVLEKNLAKVVSRLKDRYPNLQQVFLSSRFASPQQPGETGVSPEPYAFEGGYAVKWLIEAQINQMANGGVFDTNDPNQARVYNTSYVYGSATTDHISLNYNDGSAPWLAWGPYLWTPSATQRQVVVGTADLAGGWWQATDIEPDNTHLTESGEWKVGNKLMTFFLNSPYTASWFTAAGTAPSAWSPTVSAISSFNDEFNDAATFGNWSNRQTVENTPATPQYSDFDINSSTAGNFVVIPTQSSWYTASVAPYLYKSVSPSNGNFVISTKVNTRSIGSASSAPGQTHNDAGILVRSPASATPGSAQVWQRYFLGFQGASTGFSGPAVGTVAEHNTSTLPGIVNRQTTPNSAFNLALRMCRIGNFFYLYRSSDESSWTMTNVFYNASVPTSTVQIGLGAEARGVTADLRAEFDYIRGGVPTTYDDCLASL